MKFPLLKWTKKGLFTWFTAILLLTPFSSYINAGGFQLSDHSAIAMGRSQAGFGIMGDDASAGHFNPAGATLLNKQQLQLSAITHRTYWRFTDTGSTGQNTGDNHSDFIVRSIPNMHFVSPINDRLVFSWVSTAPFGSNVKYDENFFGRYSALISKIQSFNANPSLGYKLNDAISLGAGVFFQKFETKLQSALLPGSPGSTSTIEGDSTAVGYNLGAMFSIDEETRFGISYRSKTEHDLEGSTTFSGLTGGLAVHNGVFPATAKITLPESAYLAYTTPISDKWRFSFGYRWTRWSRFKETEILYPTGTLQQRTLIISNWEDTSTIALGFDRDLNTQWKFRMGLAFDESAIPSSTRTARNVESDRIWYSFGLSYASSEKSQWDFAYRYIDAADEDINENITRTSGDVNASLNNMSVHSLAIQYKRLF